MKQKRCVILIDGSNFYFKLKNLKLHQLLKFDFLGFAKNLTKEYQIIQSVYHIGKIRTDGSKKTQQLFNDQRKLFAHLKKNSFKYSLGYLLKTDGKFHEKGVDVNIAVDILVTAYEDIADHIILISSDTDLLPAIRKAKQKGKTIEYIGFSHMPSVAMVANCSKSRLLTVDDLSPFVEKGNKK